MNYKFYSYRLDHDFGFAPNPFGKYCTLANCMQKLRSNNNLTIGDWIFGLGSSKLNCENHLIYAMQVDEVLGYNEYWNDDRFQYKKPSDNGSLKKIHGDNIYRQDSTGEWLQLPSLHSFSNGKPNDKHIKKDISGKNVLISKTFYYFGDQHFLIPIEFRDIIGKNKRGYAGPSIPQNIGKQFINFLQYNYTFGIQGDPINWNEYDQLELIF